MKNIFFLLVLCTGVFIHAQEGTKSILGQITDGRSPIENVAVTVEGKSGQTFSDADGRYKVGADVGDRILYNYSGLKTVAIKVEDVTRILNIKMIPDVEELEEVTVEASKRRSQAEMQEDYTINKNIIRTAWGYLDAERAAGNVRTMSEEEINPVTLCILDVLRNQFPGVQVTGSCTTGISTPGLGVIGEEPLQVGGQVRIRPGSSLFSALPAVFDIDGQIFNDVPLWLDVSQIKRIAILNNLATTAPYGNLGAGGVIVINTVGGNPRNNEFVDRARLRNNYADGLELSREEVANNAPTYLKELRGSGSFEGSR
ncbi:MAG: carboxypeptidase-like regulatory domain-containing protein, partial [Croceivirga sp.]